MLQINGLTPLQDLFCTKGMFRFFLLRKLQHASWHFSQVGEGALKINLGESDMLFLLKGEEKLKVNLIYEGRLHDFERMFLGAGDSDTQIPEHTDHSWCTVLYLKVGLILKKKQTEIAYMGTYSYLNEKEKKSASFFSQESFTMLM
jgi:hypothetical protein